MGVTCAHKARQVLELAQQVIAIELLCAAQMLEFRKPFRPGIGVQQAYELVRARVPMLNQDRVLAGDIALLTKAIKEEAFATVLLDNVSRETL
jgi:histidine ammonia-lyase